MPAIPTLFGTPGRPGASGRSSGTILSSGLSLSTWARAPSGSPLAGGRRTPARLIAPAGSGPPGLFGQAGGKTPPRLATLLDRVVHGRERVVLTRRGRPLAAMVSLEDLRLLEDLEDRADRAAALAALAENGGHRAWEDVLEVLGL